MASLSSATVIPSGCTILDLVLGGGWPEGRITNVVGDSATGKSLLAIEACSNFHHLYPDGDIVYIETEGAFDPVYAKAVGFPPLDSGRVHFPNDDEAILVATIEEFFELLDSHIKAKPRRDPPPSIIVLDSLDGLSDAAEMERSASDKATYGMGKAKTLSIELRKAIKPLRLSRTTLMIVSQIRENIGASFGAKYVRAGGKALKFYATTELWLRHKQRLIRKVRGIDRTYGVLIEAEALKNRRAPPFRKVEFELHFSYGVEDLLSCALFLEKSKVEIEWSHSRLQTWIRKAEDGEYEDRLDTLIGLTEERWRAIESETAPARSKYGDAGEGG